MKSKIILYAFTLIGLSMAACAPTADELADIKKKYSGTRQGISGLVVIQHADLDPDEPQLTPQISVEFERQSSSENHLILARSLRHIQPDRTDEKVVSIGCDEVTDVAKMPATLDVDTLIICGKHTIEHTAVNIKAKKIVLDNANLEFIPRRPLRIDDSIEIATEYFFIHGENHITLQGAAVPGGREMPPTLILDAGVVGDSGHLKVYSKASIYSVKL
ncbi:hypothetical protein ACNQKP_09350 [Bdellovibrio bacteriovorus]|uniref:hypothetical protein n=1 Tax=Bdellovibrio bacteriovorus TaxID=959 RepID=UPI003AA95A7C